MSYSSSPSHASQLASDEEFARRLQAEELRGFQLSANRQAEHFTIATNDPQHAIDHLHEESDDDGEYRDVSSDGDDGGGSYSSVAPQNPSNMPLLERIVSQRSNRSGSVRSRRAAVAVHRNAASAIDDIRETSPRIIALTTLYGIGELLTSIIIFALYKNDSCDFPLATWSLFYSFRWIISLPILLYRFSHQNHPGSTMNRFLLKIRPWIDFIVLMWFIIGQYWVYSSESCDSSAPVVYRYSLTLVALFYARLLLPLIFLFTLCLCLPVALIFMRVFSTKPGATTNELEKIPVKIWQPQGDAAEQSSSDQSCSICIDDYVAGDEVRVLPCRHVFHKACIDTWLQTSPTCALCRGSIRPDGENPERDRQASAIEV